MNPRLTRIIPASVPYAVRIASLEAIHCTHSLPQGNGLTLDCFETFWSYPGLSRYITDLTNDPRNALVLETNAQEFFDNFHWAIEPKEKDAVSV